MTVLSKSSVKAWMSRLRLSTYVQSGLHPLGVVFLNPEQS